VLQGPLGSVTGRMEQYGAQLQGGIVGFPKRKSADISPSASKRSRSTIANKPATSFGLVLWGRSQPLSAHCFKLIFASDHEQTWLA
jgi:hypothetical protein